MSPQCKAAPQRTLRRAASGISVLFCVLLVTMGLGCSGPAVTIEVMVTGLTADSASLDVALDRTLAGDNSKVEHRKVGAVLDHFFIELDSRIEGPLELKVRALGEDRCLRALGTQTLQGPLEGRYATTVELVPPAAPSCTLTITMPGDGVGSVSSIAVGMEMEIKPELNCPPDCTRRLSGGTQVNLVATADAQSVFLGWSGACSGVGVCTITAGDESSRVAAVFSPLRVCTKDPSHSFCWDNPLPQGNALSDVWIESQSSGWAAGGHGTVLRWNGNFWAPLATPVSTLLSGIWGDLQGRVWTTGDYGTALHWDGTAWQRDPTPVDVFLTRVRGAVTDDSTAKSKVLSLWTVGAEGTTLQWVNEKWQKIPSGVDVALLGIWVLGPSDAWAVGAQGTALHWDGQRWNATQTGTTQVLRDVWASGPKDVWAVGDAGTVLHYDGTGWLTIPFSGVALQMRGVWGTGPANIWISGTRGQLWHFDGSSWQTAYVGTKVTLQAIHGLDENNIWFVGESGYIVRWNGVYISSVGDRTAAGQTIRSMWLDDDSAVRIYGGDGQIFVRSGERWIPTSQNSATGLYSVIPLPGTNGALHSVSVFGEIGTYVPDFNTWLLIPSGTTQPLTDIWASSEGNFWAVGFAGALVHGVDYRLSLVPSGTTEDLTSVWGSAANDVWAVGQNGTILHWNGSAWTRQPSPSAGGLLKVWGLAADKVWAVGGGVALRFDGTRWVDIGGPKIREYLLTSVWAKSETDVWATVSVRQVAHFDGSNWELLDSGFDGLLNQVLGTPSGELFVAGNSGAILRHRGPGLR